MILQLVLFWTAGVLGVPTLLSWYEMGNILKYAGVPAHPSQSNKPRALQAQQQQQQTCRASSMKRFFASIDRRMPRTSGLFSLDPSADGSKKALRTALHP